MPPAPDTASAPPFASPANASLGQKLLVQLRIVLGITLAFTALETLVFGQATGKAFLYTLVICICCSTLIQTSSRLLLYVLNARRPPDQAPRKWLGWPWMSVCLVLGTLLGYGLGSELANWISGHDSNSLAKLSLRQGLTILFVSLVPGIVVTLYFFSRSQVEAAHALALSAQRAAAENQLRLLQSQLEPHMLFNTLANLRVLIGMDPARAQQMLDQLIAFLRATLTASRLENHPLRDEFERLKDYLALMQIRMGSRLRPQLDLPAELADLPVAPLLMQPLVENAIKHGLEPAIDGGELRISASQIGSLLQLDVLDSGIGLQQAAHKANAQEGTQFGLHQVRERLATQYGPQASLSIGPGPQGGTLARIILPLPSP